MLTITTYAKFRIYGGAEVNVLHSALQLRYMPAPGARRVLVDSDACTTSIPGTAWVTVWQSADALKISNFVIVKSESDAYYLS